MKELIALKNQSYDRKLVKKGEKFTVKPEDAAVLILVKAAKEFTPLNQEARRITRVISNTDLPKKRGRPKGSYKTK